MGNKKIFDPTVSLGNVLLILTFVVTSAIAWGVTRTEIQHMKEQQIEFKQELKRLYYKIYEGK